MSHDLIEADKDLIATLASEVAAELLDPNFDVKEYAPDIISGSLDPNNRSNVAELKKTPDPAPSLGLSPGISVKCDICGKAEIADPYFQSQGLAEFEKFKHLRKIADQVGWSYKVENDVCSFICPACFGGKYEAKKICPKCGNKKLTVSYCTGEKCYLGINRSHLHLVCNRCKFIMACNTLDYKE